MNWLRKFDQKLTDREFSSMEQCGELPGGHRLNVLRQANLQVVYLDTQSRVSGCKRWIALTTYCWAKQAGPIRSPMPPGDEYQQQFVVSAEGESKQGAWYALLSEMCMLISADADRTVANLERNLATVKE